MTPSYNRLILRLSLRIGVVGVAFAVIAVTLPACGSSHVVDSQRSATTPAIAAATTKGTKSAKLSYTANGESYLKYDGDPDSDDHPGTGPSTDDQETLVAYGHPAKPADRQAITTVVRAYYAAALAADGSKGCSLLQSGLASDVAEEQGRPGATCATALSALFEQEHQHLAGEEVATMAITGVYAQGNAGSVTLGFHSAPEAEIVLAREGRAWKVDALFDSELP